MNCVICGAEAKAVKEKRRAKYRNDVVEVEREFFRCESCTEEFVSPKQMNVNVRSVKNEIRRKYGLLSPERIVDIRKKLKLTQDALEEVLHAGPKVVVRWESGKVIQSAAHDNMLRLLEREPSILKLLLQIQELRSQEQKKYAPSQTQPETKVRYAV